VLFTCLCYLSERISLKSDMSWLNGSKVVKSYLNNYHLALLVQIRDTLCSRNITFRHFCFRNTSSTAEGAPADQTSRIDPISQSFQLLNICKKLSLILKAHSNKLKMIKQVSISPTFYEQLSHTKVFCAAFLNFNFWLKE